MRDGVTFLLVTVLILGGFLSPTLGSSPSSQDESRDVFDEARLPSGAQDADARRDKCRRYDTGGHDLTADAGDSEYFAESIWPRVDLGDSDVIVVGTVRSRQPYLSQDRSRIFTEFVVDIESLIKTDSGLDRSAGSVTMDRLGGALRLTSGLVVRDDIQLCFLGWPEVGGRYVLFARRIHDGKDLEFFHGYRLVDGKALPIVPRHGATSKPDSPESEASLLESLRSWADSDESGASRLPR